MERLIRKSNGELELFRIEKIEKSLKSAGADTQEVSRIISLININIANFVSTDQIHNFAISELSKRSSALADSYHLKRALTELGPSGFPFEKYIAELFKLEGYDVKLNQIVKGRSVEHEVDLIITKNNETFIVEAKFHNSTGIKTGIQVPLYVNSRLKDLQENLENKFNGAFIVTNTTFSTQASIYSRMNGIRVLSWTEPNDNSLPKLIQKHKLHPITAISIINQEIKSKLISKGLVLCSQIVNATDTINKDFDSATAEQIKNSSSRLCNLIISN